MEHIKEITVFATGDSTRLSTWSNVPYFITETLIRRGIRVNRVDISPDPLLENLWNKTMGRLVQRVLTRNTEYSYVRSHLHFGNIRKRIRDALRRFPDAGANLFLTFSFSSAGLTDKPTVLLCDWTYDYYFSYYANRAPAFMEKRCLKREDAQIEKADLVLSLFPGVADYMRRTYKNRNIHYLGNVINSLYESTEAEAIDAKANSWDLLFVGGRKYLEGARALIEAFTRLRPDFPALRLQLIGLNESSTGPLPEGAFCHGYLDKSNSEQRALYYHLLRKARIFVNTTPKWGAFSATLEAMHFHVPVVVTPYHEFVETFGREIPFGKYCESNSPVEIETAIRSLLNEPLYNLMCREAHRAVSAFTWDAYVEKMIRKLEAPV